MKSPLLLWYGVALLIVEANFIGPVMAQDAHYWTEQYGSRSVMLGGNVIGSVKDQGAVYYNPARLGLVEKPSFLLAAQVYELRNTNISNAVSEGITLKDSKFGGIPSLVAGTFTIKKFGDKHHFAYAFLNRFREEGNFFVRTEITGDVIERLPGEEEFDGNLGLNKKLTEEWAGLTWACPLSSKFSVGITAFGTNRNQESDLTIRLSALSEETGDVAVLIRDRTYSYQTYGVLAKIGLAFETKAVSAGLTITTPKLNLSGNGSFLYDDLFTGLVEENGQSADVLALSVQGDLRARHRLPWAVGLGAGFNIGKSKLHLSSEWFGRVNRYTVMAVEDFVSQSADTVIQNRLVDELNSVLNFGAGFELFLSEKFSAHASVATNLSPVISTANSITSFEADIFNSTYRADFLHFGGGISLNIPRWEFTLGATYGGSTETIRLPVNIPSDSSQSGGIFEQEENAELKTNRWRFIFAFSFAFLNNLEVKDKGDK